MDITIKQLIAQEDTRPGRMLAAGQVRCTVTSKKSGEHITVRFKCCKKNESGTGKKWPVVPLHEATHVFIDVPRPDDGFPDKIGTFYPKSGKYYPDRNAHPARLWAAWYASTWLSGIWTRDWPFKRWHHPASIFEEVRCGRCGRELTDPESIARGVGPECFGKETGSQHHVKHSKCEGCDAKVPSGQEFCDECSEPSSNMPSEEEWREEQQSIYDEQDPGNSAQEEGRRVHEEQK